MREIIYYTTTSGRCYVQEFFDSLSDKVFQKIVWVLQLVTELDIIPKTYFKKLANTDDIWECRIKYGSNIYRIFCFFDNDALVVLTHGFIKKSRKTPKNEIVKAENYKKDYLRRR